MQEVLDPAQVPYGSERREREQRDSREEVKLVLYWKIKQRKESKTGRIVQCAKCNLSQTRGDVVQVLQYITLFCVLNIITVLVLHQ